MNNVMKQVAGVVAAVTIFALLAGVGYITQVGMSQTFGPADPPRENRRTGLSNKAYGNGWEEERDPIPEGESVWEDHDDLDQEDRLADRPGNFEVVSLVGEFFRSVYQVRPDFEHVAYPYQSDSKVWETKELHDAATAEAEAEARKTGRKEKNKLRSYNVVIHKVTLVNLKEGESGIPNATELGVSMSKIERLGEVRERHPERCVVTLLRVGLESLQSDKVEGDRSDSDMILCWVKKPEGWKLVWFEK